MSKLSFPLKIALRYLWSRRGEAFITILSAFAVLGVAIGVMVLTITMAIMTGFEGALQEKIVGSAHVQVYRLGGRIYNWESAKATIKNVPGVKTVSAYTQNQALLTAEGRSKGIMIRGVEQGDFLGQQLERFLPQKKTLTEAMAPQTISENDAVLPAIVIGRELARQFSLNSGVPVSLLAPQVSSSPFGMVPRFKRYAIGAIYSSGLTGYEEALAYMDLAESQKFFRANNTISGFEIQVDRIDRAPAVATEIVNALGGLGTGFYAQDWTESNKELWEAIHLEKRVYFIVLLLIIVMASFSIIAMLIMIVLEKRKDIAVLKTLGARTSTIALIFRLQGAIIGFLGVFGGLLFGYLGCLALDRYGFPLPEKVFPTNVVPVQIDAVNFAAVGIAAFAICLISTWYPARRAASVEPSEVLRYE